MIIEGGIFVFCVLAFRRGIVGVIAPYITGTWASPANAVPQVEGGSVRHEPSTAPPA